MSALIAFIIVALSVIAITYKTYVGYGDYRLGAKIGFLVFLIIGWSAPFVGFYLRYKFPDGHYSLITNSFYFLFGFVFYLFVISFVRDTVWMIWDFIRRVPVDSMKNPQLLLKVNLYTVGVCLLFCLYGVYEARKDAMIRTYDIVSNKIKSPVKLVMLSDLHIDTDVSPKYVRRVVERVNALNPDVIALVGDVIDNEPKYLFNQGEELKKLKAKNGVFVSLGNHEFYNGFIEWVVAFGQLDFNILNSWGQKIGDTGLYLAGVPDINAAQNAGMKIKLANVFGTRGADDYTVLLSHAPILAEGITKDNVDLQLSGHTHGGQIFPFHYFTRQANDGALAGFYDKDGVKLYVSRGTRYWGPPMRVFAPSEITVFNFLPENDVKSH